MAYRTIHKFKVTMKYKTFDTRNICITISPDDDSSTEVILFSSSKLGTIYHNFDIPCLLQS